ncbi:asparagine synthase (glutamine-hydrolyzing) [Francisella sp. 19X1-34]|uniref:asparagine synthase (glutamine-hydrolyzing) n=1 Tax=Francisella sp. 19X1-34 TaxID=3087177 RepID=UPI002E377264|nr:asparagine synthase (glutamine-hydrolyzing) [Francisella sp. 19X1-34]MED7787556.1 asparagine synthase (glutamine-hydrolyzing) [Francisella sp. 19X1-34]
MCGIVGALALGSSSVDISSIKKMADVIQHRGPDDAGYLCFHTGQRHSKKVSFFLNLTDQRYKQVDDMLPCLESASVQKELHCHDYDLYMGHRRLSIIDVSRLGHQPMSDLSKNIWIAYNGEIYNYKDLRKELESLGYAFKSETDTEVIIYSYAEWGIDCVKKLNGMFAFSLYDNLKKKFYLVRDRYGIKPIYYHITQENTFLYGNEIKSILEYGGVANQVDEKALKEYFTFQNILSNRTLNKDIHILEAGHYFEIDLSSQSIAKRQYWDFDFKEPEIIKDEKEYIEELDRLFKQAVERQLVADVPVGTYLSGGMDSGSITSIAASKLPYLNTFTVGFDLSNISGLELAFDERSKAEFMSYKFKTEHYEMVLKSGDMERCMNDFAYHLEEPRVGQSYPNYYAAKLASKFVKVVLGGAGGDELFAGYPWRYNPILKSKSFDDFLQRYYSFWQRLFSKNELNSAFASNISDSFDSFEVFRNIFDKFPNKEKRSDYINFALYFEAKTFLHGLLVVEDKLSMAHSLEARVPFLDNDLVDFAQKVPAKFKLSNISDIIKMKDSDLSKLTKTNNGKEVLRKAMSKRVPEEIYKAVKQGFSSPDNSWFRGESIDFVRDSILNKNARLYSCMDYGVVSKMIKEHLSGEKNRRLLIWSLLNFNQWMENYGL